MKVRLNVQFRKKNNKNFWEFVVSILISLGYKLIDISLEYIIKKQLIF
jgi:hypothetical protein